MALKTGVLYLQKDKFQYYSGDTGRVFEFRFVPEVARDLDVLNSELMENLIKVFITNSKIAPANVVFVLAENAYFTKDFVNTPVQKTATTPAQPLISQELLKKQADEFIEHVPFDNIVSRTIPLKNGIKVCATNKDFYESIAIALEHLGFTIASVVPGLVLGNGLSLRPVMDQAMANVILQKINTVKEYDLLGQQVFQPFIKQETEEVDEVELDRLKTKKPDRNKLILLIGVGVILVVLVVIIVMQFQTPPPRAAQPAVTNTNAPAAATVNNPAAVKPTAAVTTAVGSDTLPTQNLTVQIVDTSGTTATAQTLMSRLEAYKFKNVSLKSQTSTGSSNTLVSFSPSTTQAVKNAVLAEVNKVENNVAVQEKQIGANDITIVLGQ